MNKIKNLERSIKHCKNMIEGWEQNLNKYEKELHELLEVNNPVGKYYKHIKGIYYQVLRYDLDSGHYICHLFSLEQEGHIVKRDFVKIPKGHLQEEISCDTYYQKLAELVTERQIELGMR